MFLFAVWEKLFSSLMRISSSIFRHWEIDKVLVKKVSFAYLRILVFWNLGGPPTWVGPGLFVHDTDAIYENTRKTRYTFSVHESINCNIDR